LPHVPTAKRRGGQHAWEALLANQFITPGFLIERYSAVFQAGVELAARRAKAAQDYWSAMPHLREPKDVVALQTGYWRQALADYGEVMTEAMARPPADEPAPAREPLREAALAA
jgi:hypothetical protein